MFVRLAFSIATMVRPDVLVIDEALSVGDMAFQRKCIDRMTEFRAQQKTMVFCSHSMYHIQQLCDQAIWIDKGHIREMGSSDEVVGHYEDYCNNKRVYNSITEETPAVAAAAEEQPPQRDCRIISVSVQLSDGTDVTTIPPLSDLDLRMEVEILNDSVEGNFGFAFMRSADDVIASFLTTDVKDVHKGPFKKGDRFSVTIRIENIAMRVGQFYVLGGVADKSGLLWYETKPSKPLQMAANRGVGAYAMKSSWTVEKTA
jgi:ABC-type glutathione transport system ATPase component